VNRKIEFDFGKKKKMAKERKRFLAKGLAIGAAAGSALGALSGILFAPKSGKETRQLIKEEVTEAAKKASEEVKTVSEKAAVGLKEVSEKAAVGIKDLATMANEIVVEKIKFKKDDCSCCEEVAAVEETSVPENNKEETEKAEDINDK
jgi:gas vesicle protein